MDKIALILQAKDRKLATRVGKALASQRVFHDVCYETQLVDSIHYLYEFSNQTIIYQNNDSMSEIESTTSELVINDSIPNGVLTELTFCYSPTCWSKKPCYSPTCPKRIPQFHYSEEQEKKNVKFKSSQQYPNQHDDDRLWANRIDKETYNSIPKIERKRQENLYELIYTEEDYVLSLGYLQTVWIKPLRERPIIPTSRRESFIHKVFRNIASIYEINIRLLNALKSRQDENPIIYQIGDILLDFVIDFEPYIAYGSKQHEARFTLESEKYINSNFEAFATERHPSSLKLELNGYLTKPTTRLGRYTLLFNEILKHTPDGHPDKQYLPKAISIIKQFLSRVNFETGQAKTRFDLERIHYNLSFKYKTDETTKDLDLLAKNRSIIKQGTLKKTAQADSVEYQIILFDHYLCVAKLKMSNGVEKYVMQKKPIPIELLHAYIPKYDPSIHNSNKRSNSIVLPYLTNNNPNNTMMVASTGGAGIHVRASTDLNSYLNSSNEDSCYPISFQHLGRDSIQLTLFASSAAVRKTWIDKIKAHQEDMNKKKPIFKTVPVFKEHAFQESNKINHFITFNSGQQYLLAADDGVYVGHHNYKQSKPHKILSLDRVAQIQAIESTQTLLVLADRMLWEYPLDAVNNKPESQPLGRLIQTHVPFFYVGTCLQRTMVCIPKISTLHSVISAYEPIKKEIIVATAHQHNNNSSTSGKRRSLMNTLLALRQSNSMNESNLRKIKDCYVPCEAYAVELSATMMLITTSRGVILIDMRTDQPQQLLNPADKSLSFIIEREKEPTSLNLRQSIKRIAIFRTPRNHYFVCYDEYAFYIDSKGNRLFKKFLIEWEGSPEFFAFSYPFVIAFHSSFIEIRNVFTGTIEQIILGAQMKCLNNGHKAELALIFGSMVDPENNKYRMLFKLQLTDEGHNLLLHGEPSTVREKS
ncbi:hypothetical protein G6F37_006144 [Rhizopus arrhizus]|nr:hypothetical protein G6F38_008053 [Rhizopus arrhizus]KAG1158059.1 hypothetical protein G6F37_006144 [Rhizopus arrhizus]